MAPKKKEDQSKSIAHTTVKMPSPPRKQQTKRESTKRLDKLSSANQVKFKYVGIDQLAVGFIYKPDGSGPAFLGNIISFIEGNDEHMEKCKLMTFTKLRNPDGSNELLETENKSGNKYPSDIVVFATDESTSILQAAGHFSKTLTSIANNECKGDWKFGIPFFVNKGDATPPSVLPLAYYLLNEDCVTVMKRTFEGIDCKEDFMNNEFRNEILKTVFGDADAGFQVIEGMPEELYDEL